jgi:Common central domain of tyrosinase
MTKRKRLTRSLHAGVFVFFSIAVAAPLTLLPEVAAATPVKRGPEAQSAEAAALQDVRTISIEAYMVRRGLKQRTLAAEMARRRLQNLPPNVAAVAPITGTAVAGSVGVPIVTVKFKDTASSPYPVSDLQRERGHIQQQSMEGSGPKDVLVVDEVKELAPNHDEVEQSQQRKSVNALTANELTSLRRGVAQMKAWNTAPRDSANFRRSWLYWANMHAHFGQSCVTDNPSNFPGMGSVQTFTANASETATWCKCEHGTDFFLTWHRMFLWYFERVLQAAAGDPSLRLPFWDYATDHSLPAAYRDHIYVNEAGQTVPNPLRVDARQTRVNTGTPLATGMVSAGPHLLGTSHQH